MMNIKMPQNKTVNMQQCNVALLPNSWLEWYIFQENDYIPNKMYQFDKACLFPVI